MASTASTADKVDPPDANAASSEDAREPRDEEAGVSAAYSSSVSLSKAATSYSESRLQDEGVAPYEGIARYITVTDIEIGSESVDVSALTSSISDSKSQSLEIDSKKQLFEIVEVLAKENGISKEQFLKEQFFEILDRPTEKNQEEKIEEGSLGDHDHGSDEDALDKSGKAVLAEPEKKITSNHPEEGSKDDYDHCSDEDVLDKSGKDEDEKTEEGSKDDYHCSDEDVLDKSGKNEDVLDKSGKEVLSELEEKITSNNPVTKEQTEGVNSSEDSPKPPDTSTEEDKVVAAQAAGLGRRLSLRELPGATYVRNEPREVEGAGGSPVPFPPGDDTDISSHDNTSSRSPRNGSSSNLSEDDADGQSGGPPPVMSSSDQNDFRAEFVFDEETGLELVQLPNAYVVVETDRGNAIEHSRRSENSQRSIQDLQEQLASERRRKFLTRILCGLSLFLFMAAMAATILLALGLFEPGPHGPPGPPEVASNETVDTICPHGEPFWDVLDWDVTLDLEKQLQDELYKAIVDEPCSSQSLANDWVLGDPHRDTYSQERLFQRFMMASAWLATNGTNWKNNDNWMSYNVSECEWHTMHPNKTICDENNVLRIANLTNNGLQGTVPTEALQLTRANILDFSHNRLSGGVPYMSKEVAMTVEYMDYSDNNLEGQFLIEYFMDGMALRHFNVRGNRFSGTLPMFYMPKMTHLDMRDNLFVGTIPSTLSELGRSEVAKLEVVLLGGNKLTGTVPQQVGLLKNLRIVDFSDTELRGALPQELGSLLKLEWVDLTATKVTGQIPEVLCEREDAGLLMMATDCGGDQELQCCPPM